MNQDQNKAPIFDAAMKYAKLRPAYFCVPGHRYENGPGSLLREYAGDNIFKIDITETEITDDLHCPVGAIKEAQELAAELFGADHTFFLVNGSTCGNHKTQSKTGLHSRLLNGLRYAGLHPLRTSSRDPSARFIKKLPTGSAQTKRPKKRK